MALTPSEKQKVFTDKITKLYPTQHQEILTYLGKQQPTTFRINTLRSSPSDILSVLKEKGFNIVSGPLPNSYIVQNETDELRLSLTEIFTEGLIYIQSLSSMLPVLALDPKSQDEILDICAAPGSKTTQIISMTGGLANILAVDKNRKRIKILQEQVDFYPTNKARVEWENGTVMYKKFPEFEQYFTKILADVPCTNEAYINPEELETFRTWNPKTARKLSRLQKKLLWSAWYMLRPGGKLVYSTCTLSVEENEMVIDWLLQRAEDAQVAEISWPAEVPTVNGFTRWRNKQFKPELELTRRVIPNEQYSGFYIAELQKKS